MARRLRTDGPGAWHHVMNRGGRRRAVFLDGFDRRCFLRLLETATAAFPVEIHAFCLMDNHFHLLTRTVAPPLGEAMRFVGQQYTQYFNRRHGFDGALFRGRYHAEFVDDDVYLLAVSRYIHRNPLAIDPGLRLQDYPWSSYGAYLGTRVTPWLTTEFTLNMFSEGRRQYGTFVDAPHQLDLAA